MPAADPSTAPDAAALDAALAALRAGQAIGLPTETVYGLAADARDEAAVARIFALKGRPADHPLIVHLAPDAPLEDWARDVPPAARALAAAFWPGPLTLILPRARGVSDLLTGGQDTVGLRIPAHPAAQALLRAFGGALAAPSANRFGRISPTTAAHVREEFGDAVPVVLDGGASEVGIESTIVDLSGDAPRILRPGAIGRPALEAVLGEAIGDGRTPGAPRVSGSLDAHYAPRTPLRMLPADALGRALARHPAGAAAPQVLALDLLPPGAQGLALPAEPRAYARGLYAALRTLDARGAPELLLAEPPRGEAWDAVHDRLRRACAGSGA